MAELGFNPDIQRDPLHLSTLDGHIAKALLKPEITENGSDHFKIVQMMAAAKPLNMGCTPQQIRQLPCLN